MFNFFTSPNSSTPSGSPALQRSSVSTKKINLAKNNELINLLRDKRITITTLDDVRVILGSRDYYGDYTTDDIVLDKYLIKFLIGNIIDYSNICSGSTPPTKENDIEFIDTINTIIGCIDNINSRFMFLYYTDTLHSYLLKILEYNPNSAYSIDIIMVTLRCIESIANNVSMTQFSLTKLLLICSVRCSTNHPNRLLFLECVNDIVEGGETKLLGTHFNYIKDDMTSPLSSTSSVEAGADLASMIRYCNELSIPCGCSTKLFGMLLFRLNNIGKKKLVARDDTNTIRHESEHHYINCTVKNIYKSYYSKEISVEEAKSTHKGKAITQVLSTFKKAMNVTYFVTATQNAARDSHSLNPNERTNSIDDFDAGEIFWPPLDTGYSLSVWFKISCGDMDGISTINDTSLQYTICEVYVDTDDMDENVLKSSVFPKFKLYVTNTMKIAVEISNIPDIYTTDSSSNALTLQCKSVIFRKLPLISTNTWHHLCVRHSTNQTVRQTIVATLDGKKSDEETLFFPLTENYIQSQRKYIQADDTIRYSVRFGIETSHKKMYNHPNSNVTVYTELFLGPLYILSMVLSDEQTEYLYSRGSEISTDTTEGVLFDNTSKVSSEMPYCAKNSLLHMFEKDDIVNRNRQHMPESFDSGTESVCGRNLSIDTAVSSASRSPRSNFSYSSEPSFNRISTSTKASKNGSKESSTNPAKKNIPIKKFMLSLSRRWTAVSNDRPKCGVDGGKRVHSIVLSPSAYYIGSAGNIFLPSTEHILVILQLLSVSDSPTICALSLRMLVSITRSSSELRKVLSESPIFSIITFIVRLKCLQGMFKGIAYLLVDLVLSLSNVVYEDDHRAVAMWKSLHWDKTVVDNEISPQFLCDYKLFGAIGCNPLILGALDRPTLESIFHTFKTQVFVAPFEYFHPINKLQLLKASSFRNIISLVLEPETTLENVCDIIDSLSGMITSDLVDVSDYDYLVRLFIALTTSDPYQSQTHRGSFGLNVDISDKRSKHKGEKHKKHKSHKRNLLDRFRNRQKDRLLSHQQSVRKKIPNRIDYLKLHNVEGLKLARQAVGTLLLYAANWACTMAKYVQSADKGSNSTTSKGSAFKIIRSALVMPSLMSNVTKLSSSHRTSNNSSSIADASNSDFSSQTATAVVEEPPFIRMNNYLKDASSIAGPRGVTRLMSLFSIENLLHVLFQLAELATNHPENVDEEGPLVYNSRRNDPISGLISFKYLVNMLPHYISNGQLKALYTKELEQSLMGISRSLLLYFPRKVHSHGRGMHGQIFESGDNLDIPILDHKFNFITFTATTFVDEATVPMNTDDINHLELSSITPSKLPSLMYSKSSLVEAIGFLPMNEYDSTASSSTSSSAGMILNQLYLHRDIINGKIIHACHFTSTLFDLLLGEYGKSTSLIVLLLKSWNGSVSEPLYTPLDRETNQLFCSEIESCSNFNVNMIPTVLAVVKQAALLSTVESFTLYNVTIPSTCKETIVKEGSMLARSTAVTILCAFISMLEESKYMLHIVTTAPSTFSTQSTTASSVGRVGSTNQGRDNEPSAPSSIIQELIESVTQIFYAAAKTNMIEILLSGDKSFLRSSSPSPTDEVDENFVPPSLQKLKGQVNSQSFIRRDEISPDEWMSLPREVVTRCCASIIGKLCIQLVTYLIMHYCIECANNSTSAKFDWESATAIPHIAVFPSIPSKTASAICIAFNCAIRRKLIDLYCNRLQLSFIEHGNDHDRIRNEAILIFPLLGRMIEQLAELELSELKLHQQFQPDPSGRIVTSLVTICSVVKRLSQDDMIGSGKGDKSPSTSSLSPEFSNDNVNYIPESPRAKSKSTMLSMYTSVSNMTFSINPTSLLSGSSAHTSIVLKLTQELASTINSLRFALINLLNFTEYGDELLTLKVLQFLCDNDDVIMSKDAVSTLHSPTKAKAPKENQNDIDFTVALANQLYSLLFVDSLLLRHTAIAAFSALLTSPLFSYARKLFVVSVTLEKEGLLKSKKDIDIWMQGTGGFYLLQKHAHYIKDNKNSNNGTIATSYNSLANDASEPILSPLIEFSSWLSSLDTRILNALSEKFNSSTSNSKYLDIVRNAKNTKYKTFLFDSSSIGDLYSHRSDRWVSLQEKHKNENFNLLQYLVQIYGQRHLEAVAIMNSITQTQSSLEIERLFKLKLGQLQLHSMQRKIDTLALNASVTRQNSLTNTPVSPSNKYNPGKFSKFDATATYNIDLTIPPDLYKGCQHAVPWFRSPIGTLAMGLRSDESTEGAAVMTGIHLAEKDVNGNESGTDGTMMVVCVLIRENALGEWCLSSLEGPSRCRRKIRRGNLSLLRIKDPHVVMKQIEAAAASDNSVSIFRLGNEQTRDSIALVNREAELPQRRSRLSSSPMKLPDDLIDTDDLETQVFEDDKSKSNMVGEAVDTSILNDDDNQSDSSSDNVSETEISDVSLTLSEIIMGNTRVEQEFFVSQPSDYDYDVDGEGYDRESNDTSHYEDVHRETLLILEMDDLAFDDIDDVSNDKPDTPINNRNLVPTETVDTMITPEFHTPSADSPRRSILRSSVKGNNPSSEQSGKRNSVYFQFADTFSSANNDDVTQSYTKDSVLSTQTRPVEFASNPIMSATKKVIKLADVTAENVTNLSDFSSTIETNDSTQDEPDYIRTQGTSPYSYLLAADDIIEKEFDCHQILGMDASIRVCVLSNNNLYVISPENQEQINHHMNNEQLVDIWLPKKTRAKLQSKGQTTSSATILSQDSRFNQLINIYQESTEYLQDEDTLLARRFSYKSISAIQKRSYLLVDKALEIYFSNGYSILLTLPRQKARDTLYSSLYGKCNNLQGNLIIQSKINMHGATPCESKLQLNSHPLNSMHYPLLNKSIAASNANANNMTSFDLTRALFTFNWAANEFDSITAKWVEGEITNFDYLMHLNTLSGRSYNDWACYPVIPWVLIDYSSDVLDLNNPLVYRDLSKPMGSISSAREKEARERYSSLQDQSPTMCSEGDAPYHFGTHYSSSAIVLHYLIRLQPFSSHAVALQAGRFDRPDRIFNSIKRSWMSASGGYTLDPTTHTSNLQDVKELIPEFYYLPDFLLNMNGYEMGCTSVRSSLKAQSISEIESSGNIRKVTDVELPPWCNGNPREFIRLHRAALESDYVSSNLHNWIDLIFGYKQQGKAAEEACNCFHFLSYQGVVDLDNITSKSTRRAYEEQIRDFGQTPLQLFKSAHPKKKTKMNDGESKYRWEIPVGNIIGVGESNNVCVVSISDVLLQKEGVRPLMNMNLSLESNKLKVHRPIRMSVAESSRTVSSRYNHRSIENIYISYNAVAISNATGNANDVYGVAASNKGCILLPPQYDTMLMIGYLDASMKSAVKLDSHEEWRISGAMDIGAGILLSSIAASDDGAVIITGANNLGFIYIWERKSNHSFNLHDNVLLSSTLSLDSAGITDDRNGLNSNIGDDDHNELVGTIDKSYAITHTVSTSHLHGGSIAHIAVSNIHRIFITACSQGNVVVWDLDILKGFNLTIDILHSNGNNDKCVVNAMDIDEITGDIYIGVSSYIFIFDINGRLLSKITHTPPISLDTSTSSKKRSSFFGGTKTSEEPNALTTEYDYSSDVTSICVCPIVSWQKKRAFIAGYASGSIRFWTTEINVNNNKQNYKMTQQAASPPSGASSAIFNVSESYEYLAYETFEIKQAFGMGVPVTAVGITKDCTTVFGGSADGTVNEWKVSYEE